MEKWLDVYDVLIYSTCNEGKSVPAERVKSIKTANESKCYLDYLNKLVDECNNSSNRFHADYYALSEEFQSSHKTPKFKTDDRMKISKYKNIFRKSYTKKWSKEVFAIDSVLKTNPWTYEIKDLNREIIRGSFYEKEMLLIKL